MSLRLLILILCSLLGFTVKAQQYPFADIELTAKTKKTPFEVAEVQVDSITGRITITGKVDPKTGIAPKVTLPKGRDYVITDSQGKVYQLDESGKVTAKGTREQGTQLAQQAGKGDSKNPPISNKHFKVEWLFNDELANDTTGEIPYKALVKGKTSSFELRIQPADTTKYDFFFHTENGVKVEAESKGEGLYKITRKGAFDFAQEEVWVVAKEKKDKKGKKEELIGKCILVHLSPKEVNVALVPTRSEQNLQEAIAQVQQIYEKVGVTLHITTEPPFDISDQLKNGTLPTENEFGDLSTYSPEQNAVIAKFTTSRKPKENTYYIFLVNDGTGNHGYMRLGGQYGFVYSTNARTIAHELGHGIFKLEHPFKGKNADKGKTSALMDYNQGQDFFYRDWKQINDPKVKLYAFQGQSEGKNVGEGQAHYVCIDDNLRKILYDKGYHFYNINGEPIELFSQDFTVAFMGEEEGTYYGRLGMVNHRGVYHSYAILNKNPQGYYINSYSKSKFVPKKGSKEKAVWVRINNKGEYLIENSDKTISVKGKTEIVDCLSFITIKSAEQKLSNSLLEEGISEETIKLFLGKGLSADSAEYKEIESFAKYLSTILKGKKWGFLYKSKNDYKEHYGESLFLNVLKDKKIFSEKAFKESFVIRLSEKDKPYYIKDVDLLISNFDPWEGIPEYYNAYSFDYTTFNIPNLDSDQVIDELLNTLEIVLNSSLDACPKCLTQEQKETLEAFIAKRRTKEGKKFILTNKLKERNNFIAAFQLLGAYDRYYYSIKDLEKRSFLADNNWLGEISRREKAGQASAIDIQGGHSQYVAYYGTTSAFFLGFQYFKMYGDLLALDILGKVVNKAQFLNKGFKKRLNLYKSKKSISDSKPKENISSQEIENYTESLDNLNDNYKRIIQESETLRNVEWVKGRKTSGDAVNYYLHKNSYNPEDFKPPYKANSMVEDVTINKGEKIYCIEYLDAKKPGGWLTDRSFNTLDEVRNKLALIEDFKSSEKTIVIREYRVIKPFNTRKGIVGEQYEIKGINAGKEYEGGANQIEFGKYNPYDPTNSNPIWRDYLQNTSKVTTQGSEPYLKILE